MPRPPHLPHMPLGLDAAELAHALAAHPHWALDGGSLVRTLQFPGFAAAFGFLTAVALEAQALDHHPDWSQRYGRVDIRLTTHDAGGLTALDLALAARIDALVPASLAAPISAPGPATAPRTAHPPPAA